VHTAQGEDWFMHFQDKGPYGRVVHLQPIDWSTGWPIMGNNGTPYEKFRKPKSDSKTIVNPQESDEFNSPMMGLQWQWHANYKDVYGMPTSLGVFRIYNNKSNQTIWHTPNLLLQKTPADNFTATAKLRLTAKNENQMGGIIMMGLDYSALVVKRVGNKFQLQQITCKNADKDTAEEVKVIATLDATAKDKIDYQPAIHEDIYMRMKVNKGKCQFSWSTGGNKFHEAGDVFAMKEGKWIGAKIGFVSKEPEGKNNHGWIDVDWFRVTK
jgi:beta-xylosidase